MRRLRFPLYGLLVLAFSFSWGESFAQAEEQRFYHQTGHTVRGEFLQLYLSNPNPEFTFGFPLTDDFFDPISRRRVQYFQRARFELDPAAPPGERVRQSNLGRYIYDANRGQPLDVPISSSQCRFYPPNGGHWVCYEFLEFFEKHGGLDQFGYPLSNIEFQDDRLVQYFERARFAWNPLKPRGEKVELSDVGWIYFNQYGEDPEFLLPNIPSDIPQKPLTLRVRAFTDKPVVAPGEEITLSVIVLDQNFQPVPGAVVTISQRLPSGEPGGTTQTTARTDEHGILRYQVEVGWPPDIGIFELKVTASYNNLELEASTVTSFRIWY